jgi:hypothetical protein
LRERKNFVYQETLLLGNVKEICKGRLWKKETFSIGTLLGNLEGQFVYQGL